MRTKKSVGGAREQSEVVRKMKKKKKKLSAMRENQRSEGNTSTRELKGVMCAGTSVALKECE